MMNLIFSKKINYFWQDLLIINIRWYIKIGVKNLWEFRCVCVRVFFFWQKVFQKLDKKIGEFFWNSLFLV